MNAGLPCVRVQARNPAASYGFVEARPLSTA